MPLVGARRYIEVNPTDRRVNGWLAAADVRDVDNESLLGAEYETDACIADTGGEWIDNCIMLFGGRDESVNPPPALPPKPANGFRPVSMPHDEKQFDDPWDLVSGDPFTVYAGVQCMAPSLTMEGAKAQAERKLAYVEPRQVDYHMARYIQQNGNHMGDCPLSNMIQNAEYTALREYGGYPLMAMSAPLAVCAAASNLIFPCPPDACVSQTSMWRTVGGSYVTVIAQDDAVGPANFFMTGAVTMLRGPVDSHPAIDPKTNNQRGLAERVYVPLIECMAYFATATCDMAVTP